MGCYLRYRNIFYWRTGNCSAQSRCSTRRSGRLPYLHSEKYYEICHTNTISTDDLLSFVYLLSMIRKTTFILLVALRAKVISDFLLAESCLKLNLQIILLRYVDFVWAFYEKWFSHSSWLWLKWKNRVTERYLYQIIFGFIFFIFFLLTWSFKIGSNSCVLSLFGFSFGGYGPSWILGNPFIRQFCNIHYISGRKIGFAGE